VPPLGQHGARGSDALPPADIRVDGVSRLGLRMVGRAAGVRTVRASRPTTVDGHGWGRQ
jgi:hypothetical protein